MNIQSSFLLVMIVTILVACGGSGGSPSGAPAVNVAPVANAGSDQTVNTNGLATLDGSASTDANEDPLKYSWSLLALPDASNLPALLILKGISPSFTPDKDGDYVFALIANDGLLDSTNTSEVTISAVNVAPVARVGGNQLVNTGSQVRLFGSDSTDANGDSLTYSWSISALPAGSSISPLSVFPGITLTFTPDVDGDYIFALTVNDGLLDSTNTSKVIISANTIPVANPGQSRTVETNTLVILDGSASSATNGGTLTYVWSILIDPVASNSATLTKATSEKAEFVPDVDGNYTLKLVVNDGISDSLSALLAIKATTANIQPIANAGENRLVKTLEETTLDGSGSYDGNPLDKLTYAWTVVSTPGDSGGIILSDPSIVNPNFTPDVDGNYKFSLTVTDELTRPAGALTSELSTVTFTASKIPIANIFVQGGTHVEKGIEVKLDGSGSRDVGVGGTSLFYKWSIVAVPSGSNISDVSLVKDLDLFTFTPDIYGLYDIQLVVNNGTTNSSVVTVTIVAEPVQGTFPAPLEVAYIGGLPLDSWVDEGAHSYYHISGLSAGTDYDISISALTGNANLAVYADSNFSALICESNSTRDLESCKANPTTTDLYVKVFGTFVLGRAGYTLNVVLLAPADNPLDEGTLSIPLEFSYTTGGLMYNGTVGTGDSYYQITNVIPGVLYSIRLTGLTEDAELYVYDTAGLRVALCASTGVTTSEVCEVETTGNTMLIRIDGERVINGTGFKLDVLQN